MEEIGAYEAKTHLPKLLERVEKGERITITRHGVPVAMLVPASPRKTHDHSVIIAELEQFRKGKRLGKLSLKSLIQEGRR
jgi:prevent-host-death family protein